RRPHRPHRRRAGPVRLRLPAPRGPGRTHRVRRRPRRPAPRRGPPGHAGQPAEPVAARRVTERPGDRSGPLRGFRVLEMASEGPVSFCAMLLADLGADVVRVDRPAGSVPPDGRPPRAAAFLEGYRPGVAERLGLGPDACLARNPRLVYGRATGYGQSGPLAQAAGHDINYIALSGLLSAVGRAGQPPTPPLAVAGDFGGGGAFLAVGVLAALLEAQRSGQGQVVDAAAVDGAAALMGVFLGLHSTGDWSDERGTNLLDSGAPFYDCYETADGEYVAVGALEPKFFATLVDRLGLAGEDLPAQYDRHGWPQLRKRLAETFMTRTRQEWCDLLEGTDACFA